MYHGQDPAELCPWQKGAVSLPIDPPCIPRTELQNDKKQSTGKLWGGAGGWQEVGRKPYCSRRWPREQNEFRPIYVMCCWVVHHSLSLRVRFSACWALIEAQIYHERHKVSWTIFWTISDELLAWCDILYLCITVCWNKHFVPSRRLQLKRNTESLCGRFCSIMSLFHFKTGMRSFLQALFCNGYRFSL